MHWHEPTQASVQRRTTEGKTKPELMRCLKRYLARQVYRCILPAPVSAKAPHPTKKTRNEPLDKHRSINPYSESLFKTMKYLPTFPDRFGSLPDARVFMDRFMNAYNHEHHHTGIGLHTPADVHYGHASTVSQERSTALAAARAEHPERFTTTNDPKILALPAHSWINRPPEQPDQAVA